MRTSSARCNVTEFNKVLHEDWSRVILLNDYHCDNVVTRTHLSTTSSQFSWVILSRASQFVKEQFSIKGLSVQFLAAAQQQQQQHNHFRAELRNHTKDRFRPQLTSSANHSLFLASSWEKVHKQSKAEAMQPLTEHVIQFDRKVADATQCSVTLRLRTRLGYFNVSTSTVHQALCTTDILMWLLTGIIH